MVPKWFPHVLDAYCTTKFLDTIEHHKMSKESRHLAGRSFVDSSIALHAHGDVHVFEQCVFCHLTLGNHHDSTSDGVSSTVMLYVWNNRPNFD